jgi:hypothetical protein
MQDIPALEREKQRSKYIRNLCKDSARVAKLLEGPIISFPRWTQTLVVI